MSRRVYEIARELDLSTKEVIGRLNDAGIEVKSNLAVVEDPVYERVFGGGSDGVAPEGRPEAQEATTLLSTTERLRKRSLPARILVYAAAAAVAFALAAGVGAMGALLMSGDLSFPTREQEPRPPDQQANAPRENAPSPQQQKDAAQQQEKEEDAAAEQQQQQEQQQQEEAAAKQREAEEGYVARVGQIQSSAVETFLDSHQKLLRYDALSADDLEQMRADEAALGRLSTQVQELDVPQGYEDHHEVFGSAIDELDAAVRLAYEVVADPTTATKADFDNYDRHAKEGADLLERSNEILGKDYKRIEGLQEISPL